MRARRPQTGFTLAELLITVAILAIIAAVGLPAYQGYVQTSREGVLINNIATIETFQEDFRLRNGAYQAGEWDGGADAGLTTLGWRPQADDGTKYTITVAGNTYSVNAIDAQGTTVCRVFPARTPCP
jgi:prepilin-type N-terminal cleavage/methylation domain-containing protein